jgi:hypothetical protein
MTLRPVVTLQAKWDTTVVFMIMDTNGWRRASPAETDSMVSATIHARNLSAAEVARAYTDMFAPPRPEPHWSVYAAGFLLVILVGFLSMKLADRP